MFNKVLLNIAEVGIDISRIFSGYVFYTYYGSFWSSLLFFGISVIIDTIYILYSTGIDLSDVLIKKQEDFVNDMLNKINEKYWILFPIRMAIILGSILIIDLLKRGIV